MIISQIDLYFFQAPLYTLNQTLKYRRSRKRIQRLLLSFLGLKRTAMSGMHLSLWILTILEAVQLLIVVLKKGSPRRRAMFLEVTNVNVSVNCRVKKEVLLANSDGIAYSLVLIICETVVDM